MVAGCVWFRLTEALVCLLLGGSAVSLRKAYLLPVPVSLALLQYLHYKMTVCRENEIIKTELKERQFIMISLQFSLM